jgi:hypothetical protein
MNSASTAAILPATVAMPTMSAHAFLDLIQRPEEGIMTSPFS